MNTPASKGDSPQIAQMYSPAEYNCFSPSSVSIEEFPSCKRKLVFSEFPEEKVASYEDPSGDVTENVDGIDVLPVQEEIETHVSGFATKTPLTSALKPRIQQRASPSTKKPATASPGLSEKSKGIAKKAKVLTPPKKDMSSVLRPKATPAKVAGPILVY